MSLHPETPDPALDGDTITGTYVLCPECGYCLKGLRLEGLCPECGSAYVAAEPSAERAVEAFNAAVPRRLRLWLTPSAGPLSAQPRLFMRLLVAAMALGAAFVVTQTVASYVGYRLYVRSQTSIYRFPKSPPRLFENGIVFMEPGKGRILGIEVHPGALAVFAFVVAGQLLLARGVWSAYARVARRAPVYRQFIRRLGMYAACGVPLLLVPSMLVIVIWQGLNARFPTTFDTRAFTGEFGVSFFEHVYGVGWLLLPLVSFLHPFFGTRCDGLFLLGLVAVLIVSSVTAVCFYVVHRRAIRCITDELVYVRRKE